MDAPPAIPIASEKWTNAGLSGHNDHPCNFWRPCPALSNNDAASSESESDSILLGETSVSEMSGFHVRVIMV